MRACKSWCKRPVAGALAVCVLALGASAYGQEVQWIPVSSTGPATISGNEITISTGGVRVGFDMFISGWGSAPGAPALGAYQGTAVGSDMLGANASPANPGVDLTHQAKVACASAGDCASGGCGAFEVGFCNDNQPGFQFSNHCLDDSSEPCANGGQCSGTPVCIPNSAFVVSDCGPATAVALPANGNYEFIAACQTAPVVDNGQLGYAASINFEVPTNAKGTYTITFNPSDERTLLNDGNGVLIPGLVKTNGLLTVELGRCCFGLGGAQEGCADDLLAGECAIQPSPRLFEPGKTCGGSDCAECIEGDPNACKDPTACQAGNDNLCTSNTCVPFPGSIAGICENASLFDDSESCCDPDAGVGSGLSTIDDFDDCTADTCDACTGQVSNTPATGDCDDGLGCTLNDGCDGVNSQANGGCSGSDANLIDCSGGGGCPIGECDGSFCVCTEDTPLCIDILGKVCEGTTTRCQDDGDCDEGVACVGTNLPDGNCFDEGGTVSAAVAMGAGSAFVTGAQVLIEWDSSCLALDAGSVGPCGNSIFTTVVDLQIGDGSIFYAAHVELGNPVGTRGPADILCMNFTKLAGCDACDICLASINPKNTKLTNDEGNSVPLLSCGCSKAVRTNGDIDLDTPGGDDINSDCNRRTGNVSWATPSATDSCDGDLNVSCLGRSNFGTTAQGAVNATVLNGGDIPQGGYHYLCTTSNSCGDVSRAVWTVNISDRQSIDVDIQLSPTMNPGVFSRAITFELWGGEVACGDDPREACEVIDFGGPLNFAAHGHGSLKIPKGNYSCITARDNLHTLRGCAAIECDGVRWSATFKTDPLLGGNWLVGGNLDGAKGKDTGTPADDSSFSQRNVIDIDDFGQFIAAIANGETSPGANTDCNTAHRHADINADGVVDNLDYAFILENFLATSKNCCCPADTAGFGTIVANESRSVKQYRRLGMVELIRADLNGDGMVDMDDMAAFMQGVQPVSNVRTFRKGDARSSR